MIVYTTHMVTVVASWLRCMCQQNSPLSSERRQQLFHREDSQRTLQDPTPPGASDADPIANLCKSSIKFLGDHEHTWS